MALASLIQHMIEDTCRDPDCELHNIDVACEEAVMRPSDIAFWLAGAKWMADHFDPYLDPIPNYRHKAIEWAKKAHDSLPIQTVETDLVEDR